jgi:hypothetical protein
MKKICGILFVTLVLALGAPVFAQTADNTTTELYPIDIPIVKIYPYSEGYVVTYRNGPKSEQVYIPNAWFDRKADPENLPKATKYLIGPGTVRPHMVIYYQAGKPVRLRLYVRKELTQETWGQIGQGVNLDDKFANANIEDFKIEYK